MEVAALTRAGGIVDPDTGGSGPRYIFHAQHTRLVLVGFGGAARHTMRRVVLAGDAVTGRRPRRVLHRQPGLEHTCGLNDGKQQDQQQGQGHGELRERLPLARRVLSVLRVPTSSYGFHPYPPPLITHYPMNDPLSTFWTPLAMDACEDARSDILEDRLQVAAAGREVVVAARLWIAQRGRWDACAGVCIGIPIVANGSDIT